jgi:hypothetical protein
MKKLYALFVLTALSAAMFAQDGNLKKQTYIRFGYSIPTWKYEGFDGKGDWPDEIKRSGASFEVGSIYMLNAIKIAPGMRLGINVDFLSLDYHRFYEKETKSSQNFVFVGSKIGPSFSYSPVKHLVFDTYFKFNPVWMNAYYLKAGDSGIEDDFALGYMGIKYSVGLNVRYSILMLGFEFNPGYGKFRIYDKENNEFSDDYLGNEDDNDSKKTPVPGMKFTLGLSF